MNLTDTKIKLAKAKSKKYRITDGQGLSIMIHPNNMKTWHFRYQLEKTSKDIAIGNYPIISLQDARSKRDLFKKDIFNGVDPKQTININYVVTFEEVAYKWLNTQMKWSTSHSNRVRQSIKNNILPYIGDKPIDQITTKHLITPIKLVEQENKLELASRLEQRIKSIMRYAVQQGYITFNPAQDLTGIVPKAKAAHRPALDFKDIPAFLSNVELFPGRKLTKLALKLLLLTFVRSSEMRLARWNEIDFERALWTIPDEREQIEGVRFSNRGSKMRETHIVPLSEQAMLVLQEIYLLTSHSMFIFASDHDDCKPMSENTLNKGLRLLGYDTKTELCAHGFRTMACSALVESGRWPSDAIELQMSHKERNKVRAAYIHKAQHLTIR